MTIHLKATVEYFPVVGDLLLFSLNASVLKEVKMTRTLLALSNLGAKGLHVTPLPFLQLLGSTSELEVTFVQINFYD